MKRPYFFTWSKQIDAPHFSFKSVEDDYFISDDDKSIYDFSSLSLQASFGLTPSAIIKEVKSQLDDFAITSPKAEFELKTEVTNELLDYLSLPSEGRIFYTVSGAEAIENALKMARQITGREYVLARKNSYHGATLGAVSVTGDWRHQNHFNLGQYTIRIPCPTEDPDFSQATKIIEKFGPKKFAAICLETISGVNGVISASELWWQNLQSFCKQHGILIIADEVVCAFERTGLPLGIHHYKITPDFICMAKAISGGVIPFGALWVSEKHASYYDNNTLSCGLTNYAHPLGLAALRGVLNIVKDKSFKNHLKELLGLFTCEITSFENSPHVQQVRSIGLMAAITLNKAVPFKTLLNKGLYIVQKDNSLILAPHLTGDKENLKNAFNTLDKTLEENLYEK